MKRGIHLALAAVACAALVFCGCGDSTPQRSTESRNVYAMGAVSTVKLLINQFSSPMPIALSASPAAYLISDEIDNVDELETYIEKFDAYFDVLDAFLGGKTITAVNIKNEDEEYANYERKLIITGEDLNGQTEDYTLYYTEELKKSEFDPSQENAVCTLNGVMCMYSLEINIRSEHTDTPEAGTNARHLTFRAYPYADDTSSYIEMSHRYENHVTETEQDFVYSVVSGGSLVEQSSLKFEGTEATETRGEGYKLSIQNGGGSESYTIDKQQQDNKVTLAVNYDIEDYDAGDLSGEFTIVQTEDGYAYSFNDKAALKS